MSPFNLKLPIAIGCDHAGFDCKEDLISFLEGEGVAFNDFGTYNKDSVDYPDFAHPVASAVEKGEAAFGVLLCGSANGVAITANKHQGIRAAICWGKNWPSLPASIMMPISSASPPALFVTATLKKCSISS